ncbi:unnamed protein product [Cercospora beticola]|nr:unnamed protein product [Cercospora beticola]
MQLGFWNYWRAESRSYTAGRPHATWYDLRDARSVAFRPNSDQSLACFVLEMPETSPYGTPGLHRDRAQDHAAFSESKIRRHSRKTSQQRFGALHRAVYALCWASTILLGAYSLMQLGWNKLKTRDSLNIVSPCLHLTAGNQRICG